MPMGEWSKTTYCTATGVEIHWLHDRQLSQAAAVWLMPSGNLQEPDEWPGLAHLLEHMLFAGGEQYTGPQRLLPWVQQSAGRVNATTQHNFTAYHFELAPEYLAEGLARLFDMLSAPRFLNEDLIRETQVIEEEFALYCRSPSALVDAVLQSQLAGPANFHRFRIGNLAAYGADYAALMASLKTLFQRSHILSQSQIWITAPYGIEQLRGSITELFGSFEVVEQLPTPDLAVAQSSPLRLNAWQGRLHLPQTSGLCLSTVLPTSDHGLWGILHTLVIDAAPGSLQQKLTCFLNAEVSIRLERQYHDTQQLWLTLWIESRGLTPVESQQCLAIWRSWLDAAAQLSPEQLNHYASLADEETRQLPLMERLRNIALGEIFNAEALSERWLQLLSLFKQHADYGVLRLVAEQPMALNTFTGLPCDFQLDDFVDTSKPSQLPFTFYPQGQRSSALPVDITHQAPIAYSDLMVSRYSLLLRPAPETALTITARRQLTQALAPVISLAKHQGGEAIWQILAGNDTLCFCFESLVELERCLDSLATYWPRYLVEEEAIEYGHLPLRQFLTAMPTLLINRRQPLSWVASLAGPEIKMAPRIAAKLARLPVCWQPIAQSSTVIGSERRAYQGIGNEARLTAFIPYPATSRQELIGYQQLATYYQPDFYQQLREVEAVGYAVACRQTFYRERWGLQIILQSNQLTSCQLFQRVISFFQHFQTPQLTGLHQERLATLSSCGNKIWDNHLSELISALMVKTFDCRETAISELHQRLVEQLTSKSGVWLNCE